MKYFLLVYFIAYVGVAFVWRSYQVKRMTGINPVVFKQSDDAHDFIGRVFKLLFALVALVVVVHTFFPTVDRFTGPIIWLELTTLKRVGIGLLLLSLVWTAIAQYQMGQSWRIGIDREHRSPLVHKGLFNFSRNPIYVGLIATLLGLFLITPNALTLLVLVVGVVLISIQVRLEESYLLEAHGAAYSEYQRRVRRWL
ncbi:MAG TPA: isoprenylcysteine carboxylmethyltransferase family protein [Pyrinomonadaceae bacterium]|nr:isoprenylcysteine carboxylmethyltransferase family protein [Pyrinomonadaceae bacterium]